jgi:glucokinase
MSTEKIDLLDDAEGDRPADEFAPGAGEDGKPVMLTPDEAAKLLGQAIANLVTVINPSRVLLGGGLLSGSPRMRRTVTESLEQHLCKSARAAAEIGAPALGDDAAVVGAALLARQSLATS